eukprot:c25220_g1_i2 orf=850-3552(+)
MDANVRHVTQMFLMSEDLSGTLPSAVGNLTYLTDLDLSSNPNLGGSLPAEIGNLTNLKRLFVQSCNFSGSIPSEIGNMTNLNFLGLSWNSFTGPLPATVGRLENLIWFDVSSNNLSGSLPVSSTSGIGSGLDNLTNAQHFHFQNNQFSEIIPPSLFNKDMQLIHLLLNNNSLTGSIPPSIGSLLHIEIMCLDFNSFSGPLPHTINAMGNLTTLQINNNNFTGPLLDLSNNTNLQMLIAGNNPFEASEIPSWITNMTKLYLLSMDSANLIGNIPAEIFNSHLSNVTLGSNLLNGTLDLSEANVSSLQLVNLSNNAINNLIKGNYIQELLLDGNPYCQSNPTVCTPVQAGAPPPYTSTASKCTNVCSPNYAINKKDPSSCQCAYPVVTTFTFYATTVPILEDYIDQIEETITVGLKNSPYLEDLVLEDTQTVVEVTSRFDVLKISIFPPSNMTEWPPRAVKAISYALGNQDIDTSSIGPILTTYIGPEDDYRVVHKLSTGATVGIVVGAAIFSIVIVGLVVYALKLKKRASKAEKLNKPFAAWIAAGQENTAEIPQLKGARWFSLDEIRKCTNNFSQSNEIGEGGYGKVYKGFLSSGDRVAIKRASANSLQGASEFKTEIELLSRVHHRNLVGLIGFCFEEGEQMLVYEYMPNGTLRECLSGRTGLRMDWNRRVDLVLGSARGITYLHTEANPPIIHRDIKSNNILLDEKLVAKVADFGLCKLATDGDDMASQNSLVKGTIGYLDPDYYMTNQLTTKSDVYSFGVVLLEVVTGRLPFQKGRYIVREVTTLLAKGGMELVVQELVDPNLTEYPLKALERLFEVALNCVQDYPAERLSMSEVVKELEALMQVSSPAIAMNIDMGEECSELNGQGLPYIQQSHGSSSFEYSGSYFFGTSGSLQPK